MTEWEQIKKEYKEIPVPADGPHQMLQSMAVAKKARSRATWKHVAKYGTVAAAALLVVLIVPGMLFSGGLGATCNDAAYTTETAENSQSSVTDGLFAKSETGGFFLEDTTESEMVRGEAADAPTSYGINNANGAVPEYANEADSKVEETDVWDADAVSEEILRQMKERIQVNGETYYIRSEEYPEGFERIADDQEYYINEDGLLVIVFEAGLVAPEAAGDVEFVIPADVAFP